MYMCLLVILASILLYAHTDDRFIMKHIKTIEISSFEQFAPHYLQHVNKALEEKVGMNFVPLLRLYLRVLQFSK